MELVCLVFMGIVYIIVLIVKAIDKHNNPWMYL